MAQSIIPAIIREEPEGRTARIARDSTGDAIGAALFFTPEELSEIGVNTDTAESVELHIEDGEIQMIPISLIGSES